MRMVSAKARCCCRSASRPVRCVRHALGCGEADGVAYAEDHDHDVDDDESRVLAEQDPCGADREVGCRNSLPPDAPVAPLMQSASELRADGQVRRQRLVADGGRFPDHGDEDRQRAGQVPVDVLIGKGSGLNASSHHAVGQEAEEAELQDSSRRGEQPHASASPVVHHKMRR